MQQPPSPPITLAFLEPGHFHAALTLRRANQRVAARVHLYARPGPEREAFVRLVEAFNSRGEAPTQWQIEMHSPPDPLDALIADGLADAVVLAGNNAQKLATIAALHRAGIPTLVDKPWLVSPASGDVLMAVTAGPPLALDIMTGRHDDVARLRALIVATPSVFGSFSVDDPAGPAIEIGSVHHLYKRVNGQPLIRPAWYYDTRVQGDGLVDIQSHMVDQMQWLAGASGGVEARDFDLAADVSHLQATRSGTPVPLELFQASTGLAAYPDSLAPFVHDGVLDYQCNSEIAYRLRGVPVRQSARWDQREPEGGGDLHAAHVRGTRAEIVLRHGPQTGYVPQTHLRPRPGVDLGPALAGAVTQWQAVFPGLRALPSELGYQLDLPAAVRTVHEQHFAMVLEGFLDHLLAHTWPAKLAARIRMRYGLLSAAKEAVDG